MADLLTEQKWIGEFFLPDAHDNRFSGELQYSPEDGVILTYLISHDKPMERSEILYGIFSSGEKCTLLGNFDPSEAGFALHNNLATKPGKVGFQFLILGEFIPNKGQVSSLDFSLTNLQEFFYPSYAKDRVKYSPTPDYSLETPFGTIKVGTKATFRPLTKDLTNQVYSQNDLALQELQEEYERINDKHENARFMLKSDISYSIHINLSPSLSALEAYKIIIHIADLFSLLTYSPVYPEGIQITDQSIGTSHGKAFLYPSMIASSQVLRIATKPSSHRNMPIQRNTIPLDKIISNWLTTQHDFSIIVSSVQNDTEVVNVHEAHGETTLYATQLESISYLANKTRGKYTYPIKTYACQDILDGLKNSFEVKNSDELEKSIGDLRNEIAHVQRPKTLLKKLKLQTMVRINQYLQLTIIGYILTQIGVPSDVISSYQSFYAPPSNLKNT
tara:strand:+ start:17212 stop:18549 length:1338 start_codon:yes stop_codon:yes gene_type:complete